MPLQGIHKSSKLIESGNEADIDMVLAYTDTIGYFRDALLVIMFNAERRYIFFISDSTYIKR